MHIHTKIHAHTQKVEKIERRNKGVGGGKKIVKRGKKDQKNRKKKEEGGKRKRKQKEGGDGFRVLEERGY